MRILALVVVCSMTLAIGAAGQTVPQPELGTRLINLPTHLGVPPGTLELLFTHRFTQTVNDGGARELFGLDSAADIGIGLGLGLSRQLSAEVYRSSFFKQIEAAVKWQVVRQGEAFPLGIAIRTGADYRAATGVVDRWSGFLQLVVARRVGERIDLFVTPMYASDTPTLRNAANVGLGGAYHLPHKWDVEAEVVLENRDARNGQLSWSVAVNKRVAGHAFLIYFGNSRATTTDLLVGSDFPASFKRGDVRIGFNLMRRFPG